MNRKAVGVIALTLAIGLGVFFLNHQPAVQGQGMIQAQQWDYKFYLLDDRNFAVAAKPQDIPVNQVEADFSRLGDARWEFVQTYVARLGDNRGSATFVLFKRPRVPMPIPIVPLKKP